jgi:hypothetical protein
VTRADTNQEKNGIRISLSYFGRDEARRPVDLPAPLSPSAILEQQPLEQLGHGVSLVGAGIVIDADELLVLLFNVGFLPPIVKR